MIRVLHTVSPSDDRTNPFVTLMIESLPDSVESSYFSWGRALVHRFDVIHFQWPEKLVTGRGRLRPAVKRALLRAILGLAAWRGTAVVVTHHNLVAHEQVDRAGARLLARLDRLTDHSVLLNGSKDLGLPEDQVSVIPHGHYRSTIRERRFPATAPATLLFFGLIRDYKDVPRLIRAFQEAELEAEGFNLDIIGKPWDDNQSAAVNAAVEADERGIATRLEAVTDDDLHEHILRAGLVVLPYRRLYNSGVVLLALSLDRPVLVPECAAAEELQREFGSEWVLTYPGELDGDALRAAVQRYREGSPRRTPLALDDRDWPHLGVQYLDAYRAAMDRRSARARIRRKSR